MSRRALSALRRPRPAHKGLTRSLARPPAAEKFGEGSGGEAVDRNRRKEGDHRLALTDVDVLRLLDEANVPAQRGPVVLLEVSISEQTR